MLGLPFPGHNKIGSTKPFQIIHLDMYGPFVKESLAGFNDYVTFIDDFSRYFCISFMPHKSEIFNKFNHYKKPN